MEMEYNIVKKNLEYSEIKETKIEDRKILLNENSHSDEYSPIIESNTNSYVNIISSSEENNLKGDNTNINSKRYKFISKFEKFISDGPLTSSEFIRYRFNLEKLLHNEQKCHTAVELQNISSNDKYSLNFNDIYENYRGIEFHRLNLCSTCLRWKVDRSHHCKQCGKCVLKMDHHCPWLANCVGFRNYKYFCLTVFYGFILTLIIFFTFWEVVFEVNMRNDSSLFKCCFYTITYIINFGMLSFLTWLITTNLSLVLSNQTTIERADRERFATNGTKSFNCYDLGVYRNFQSVFGSFPILWLLPIYANYKGQGIIFDS
jgi:hypothetical protein